MGLWNWVVDVLTSERTPASRQTASISAGYDDGSQDCAVATLEAPETSPAPDDTKPVERWWAPEGATLVAPPAPERPNMSAEARAFENLLISHFDGHDLKMPPLLHVAERVLTRLRDPKGGMRAVAREIEADQVVAAAVLRMANSPLYRGLHKITALQAAVTRLGVKAIRTLMMHESLRAAMSGGRGMGKDLAQLLWERSMAGACIMGYLSKFTRVDEEDARLIGLLHDIGSVIVLRIAEQDRVFTRFDIDIDMFDYLCRESHQEFGELVADAWKLPEHLKALVSGHHVHPLPDDPLRTERLQLLLADMISAMLGYAPPVAYDLLNTQVVHDLGLAERNDFVDFLRDLPDRVEEVFASI